MGVLSQMSLGVSGLGETLAGTGSGGGTEGPDVGGRQIIRHHSVSGGSRQSGGKGSRSGSGRVSTRPGGVQNYYVSSRSSRGGRRK